MMAITTNSSTNVKPALGIKRSIRLFSIKASSVRVFGYRIGKNAAGSTNNYRANPFLLFVRSVFQRITKNRRYRAPITVPRAVVNGQFFNRVVEKIAKECNHAERNRVA